MEAETHTGVSAVWREYGFCRASMLYDENRMGNSRPKTKDKKKMVIKRSKSFLEGDEKTFFSCVFILRHRRGNGQV